MTMPKATKRTNGDDPSDIRYLDGKIEMFTEWMAQRRGKLRDTATVAELAERWRASSHEITTIMNAAHARGLVHIYNHGDTVLYALRSTM